MKPRIIIEVNQGIVTAIHSDRDIDVYLADHDNIREGDGFPSISSPNAPDTITGSTGDHFETFFNDLKSKS